MNKPFELPYEKDETRRGACFGIANMQLQLNLQFTVKCESSEVKGNLLQGDLTHFTGKKETIPFLETSTYACNDKVVINYNSGAMIVLVQNSGSLKMSYELIPYNGPSPTEIGEIIGGVFCAIAIIIGLVIFTYRHCKAKKLARQLNEDSHRPLV